MVEENKFKFPRKLSLVWPALIASEICSVQPMTGPVDAGFCFDMIMNRSKNRLELKWKDFMISIYNSPLFEEGYEVYETSFILIEDKYNKEREHEIGTVETISRNGEIFYKTKTEENTFNYNVVPGYLEFKNKFLEGDTLVYFKSPYWTWMSLSGREGFAIIRDNKVYGKYITCLS